jgi:hypothetical protein
MALDETLELDDTRTLAAAARLAQSHEMQMSAWARACSRLERSQRWLCSNLTSPLSPLQPRGQRCCFSWPPAQSRSPVAADPADDAIPGS